ncbi:MAG: hypothetical protein IKA34_08350 [Bacteroidales bacterium]|nr:hypothetical protein [Bacteroidales bacterium]MBR1960559.1 hypothetical protein [Bacteroidales bacterium]
MKRIITIVIAVAAFLAAEHTADAQFLKNLLKKATTETTAASAATSNGQAAGAALKALYTQYKADGKIDLSNINNIMNLAALANNVKDLKGKTNKSAFYKDFAAGLVTGSNSLVTSSNSTAVMNGLSKLVNNVDLTALQGKASEVVENVTTKGSAALEDANQIATSVSSILKLLK